MRILISGVAGIFLFLSVAQAKIKSVAADLVLTNGHIYTVDANKTVADSIAIRGKRIVYVGDRQGVQNLIGRNTKVTDLEGKLLLPGFIDSHMHPFLSVTAEKIQYTIGNPYADTATILGEIKNYIASHPNKKYIEINGYQRATFISEKRAPPTKHDLDAIDSTRPIYVYEFNGHSAWVNSKALELAGIDANTPNPVGGVIERLPNSNEPSGQLLEQAAYSVEEHFPVFKKGDIIRALDEKQPYLSAYGLTTVHDMFPANTRPRQIAMHEAADALAKAGKMNFRLLSSWPVNPAKGNVEQQIKDFIAISSKYTHPHFKVTSFKFLIDGILEERTGFLLEAYCDNHVEKESDCHGSNYGKDMWGETGEDLVKAYQDISLAGYQVNNHAIGDAAVKKSLDAIEAAQIPVGLRPSIEHIQLASPGDIARMGRLGVTANVTTEWMVLDSYFSTFYYPGLGFERAYLKTYPYQSLYEAGALMTFSSDWAISEPDVPFSIFAGMTRLLPRRVYESFYNDEKTYPYITDLQKVFSPQEFDLKSLDPVMPIGTLPSATERARTIEQLVEAATINGAKANLIDSITGSLEVGKMADMVLLDTNIFDVAKHFQETGLAEDLEPVANAKVLATYFEGRKVYDAAEAAKTAK